MSKKFNYRDSGNGQYMSKEKAEKKPANQWEKERRNPPSKSHESKKGR